MVDYWNLLSLSSCTLTICTWLICTRNYCENKKKKCEKSVTIVYISEQIGLSLNTHSSEIILDK